MGFSLPSFAKQVLKRRSVPNLETITKCGFASNASALGIEQNKKSIWG